MTRPIAAFDLDGTLFRWQLDHELMAELETMGAISGFHHAIGDMHSRWKTRQAPFHWYENAFDVAVNQHLHTVSLPTLRRAAQNVVARSGNHVYRYTRDLIAHLRSQGYLIAAISAALDVIVEPFARAHGFDAWRGQAVDVDEDRLVGLYGGLTAEQKASHLRDLIATYSCTLHASVAVGDTLSDVGTLSMVERPIAFNPDQHLLAYAFDHDWSVVVERKNVVYGLAPEGERYALDPRSLGPRRPEDRCVPQPADAARWIGPLDSVPLGCA